MVLSAHRVFPQTHAFPQRLPRCLIKLLEVQTHGESRQECLVEAAYACTSQLPGVPKAFLLIPLTFQYCSWSG